MCTYCSLFLPGFFVAALANSEAPPAPSASEFEAGFQPIYYCARFRSIICMTSLFLYVAPSVRPCVGIVRKLKDGGKISGIPLRGIGARDRFSACQKKKVKPSPSLLFFHHHPRLTNGYYCVQRPCPPCVLWWLGSVLVVVLLEFGAFRSLSGGAQLVR